MAIGIGANFNYQGPLPNFERDSFDTIDDMIAAGNSNKLDIGHICYITGENKHCKWNGTSVEALANSEVVNNLIDGGEDKALSAEMGKQLSVEKISSSATETVIESIESNLVTNALRKTEQVLTDSEKEQARQNIEAQKELTLTVKDNGNIVISNIQGQTKEFMPATPSGDPMHWAYVNAGAEYNTIDNYILKDAPWKDMVDIIEDKAKWGLDVVDASKVKQMTIDGIVYNYATENRTSPEGDTYLRYFLVGQSNDVWVEDETKVLHLPNCWYLNGLGDITNAEMRRIVENKFIASVWNKGRAIQGIQARTLLNPYTLSYTDGIDTISNLYNVKIESFTLNSNYFKIVSLEYCIPTSSFIGNQGNLKYIACTKNLTSITHNNVRVLPINKLAKSVNISSPVISKESVRQTILNSTPTSTITITLHADAYARLSEDTDIVAALETKNTALEGTGGSVSLVSA